jgi:hypothetical protein
VTTTSEEGMDEQQVKDAEQEEIESQEDEVDLNRVFKEDDLDLNTMFPDGEMKKFLRQLDKNRRGNERFLKGMDKEKIFREDE